MNLYISYALFAILAAYGIIIIIFTSALFIKPKHLCDDGDTPNSIGVSIIIPFRNEEHNLNALLKSINNQTYKGMIEVILVNDQSEDNGVEIIKTFPHHNPHITTKIIDLHQSPNIQLTSKQQAIDLGVENATHPLLLLTDADMTFAENWIESMVGSHTSTGAAHIFGHTAITAPAGTKRSLFALLESYQLEFLFSFAHAFAKLNLAGSCMGNNVLVTKKAYQQCGGQRGVGRSIVEDRALLTLMRKKGLKTAAQEPFRVTAYTYPSQSKTQFANQMLRWAAGGLKPGGGLFLAGGLMFVQNLTFLLAILWMIGMMVAPAVEAAAPAGAFGMIVPAIGGWAIITATASASVVNFALTWIFLATSFWKNGGSGSTAGSGLMALYPLLYPGYYVFMMIETAVFLPLMLFKGKGGIRWKGRGLGA